jgi:hypothetical protein
MELENKERLLLLSAVKEQIRKGEAENVYSYTFDGEKYAMKRKKYGLAKMTTLYSLESKLTKN